MKPILLKISVNIVALMLVGLRIIVSPWSHVYCIYNMEYQAHKTYQISLLTANPSLYFHCILSLSALLSDIYLFVNKTLGDFLTFH